MANPFFSTFVFRKNIHNIEQKRAWRAPYSRHRGIFQEKGQNPNVRQDKMNIDIQRRYRRKKRKRRLNWSQEASGNLLQDKRKPIPAVRGIEPNHRRYPQTKSESHKPFGPTSLSTSGESPEYLHLSAGPSTRLRPTHGNQGNSVICRQTVAVGAANAPLSVLPLGGLSLGNDIVGCLKINDAVGYHSDKIHDHQDGQTVSQPPLNFHIATHSHQIDRCFPFTSSELNVLCSSSHQPYLDDPITRSPIQKEISTVPTISSVEVVRPYLGEISTDRNTGMADPALAWIAASSYSWTGHSRETRSIDIPWPEELTDRHSDLLRPLVSSSEIIHMTHVLWMVSS